ncbi:MAG: CRISPR-associated endonuclease Cas1 [Gammaproteobacteria bacterium]|nr:CRISPR-associated endonuclease Cas1 [Gammaproteobacteria bacterium]
MGTLYIDRKDIELRHDSGCLLIYEQGERSSSVPYSHLERIVVFNRAVLDTSVLGALAEHGISLVTLNARYPERTAQMLAHTHNEAARRIAQYQLSLDETWRSRWSRILVKRKILAQRVLLMQAMEARPDARHALFNAIAQLNDRLLSLATNSGRDSLRGIEGAAASAYFSGYCALFAPELDFTGRNRRPPKDPVNACLSLAYTLAHSDAVVACHAAGLDPLLGFYHDLSFARESLACDLLEPLRAHIDHWVWQQFRNRTLRADHFSQDKGACLLGKAGRKIFYTQWEMFAGRSRRRLRAYTRLMLRALNRENHDVANRNA